jgi:hypothetical protein
MRIDQVLTAPRSPWQNAYVERLIGAIRRECLHHVIVFHASGLRRVLRSYLEGYERSRTHLASVKTRLSPGRLSRAPTVGSWPCPKSSGSTIDTDAALRDRRLDHRDMVVGIGSACRCASRSATALLLENRGDRRPCHAMTEVLQRALDARVAPGRVLGRHPHDEAANLRKRVGPPGAAPAMRPFPRDKLPVPAKNRVRGDNRRDVRQQPTTEERATGSQAPSVVVREAQTMSPVQARRVR